MAHHPPRWLRLGLLITALTLLTPLLTSASVSVTDFKAVRRTDGSVKITWATGSEHEHSYFNLYRTSERIPLNEAGRIRQEGTKLNNTPLENPSGPCATVGYSGYQFIDTTTNGQDFWYYLEDFDCNGTSSVFLTDPVNPGQATTPTATATKTATASATPTPSATTSATASATRTATATATPSLTATTAQPTSTTQNPTATPQPTATTTGAQPTVTSAPQNPTATPQPSATAITQATATSAAATNSVASPTAVSGGGNSVQQPPTPFPTLPTLTPATNGAATGSGAYPEPSGIALATVAPVTEQDDESQSGGTLGQGGAGPLASGSGGAVAPRATPTPLTIAAVLAPTAQPIGTSALPARASLEAEEEDGVTALLVWVMVAVGFIAAAGLGAGVLWYMRQGEL